MSGLIFKIIEGDTLRLYGAAFEGDPPYPLFFHPACVQGDRKNPKVKAALQGAIYWVTRESRVLISWPTFVSNHYLVQVVEYSGEADKYMQVPIVSPLPDTKYYPPDSEAIKMLGAEIRRRQHEG